MTRPLDGKLGSVVLLASLAAIGQFSSNIYTPSLPFIAAEFAVSPGAAQFTYTVFLATLGVGQLLVGPLADAVGRRPIALWGLAVFLLGTVLAAAAPSLGLLNGARVIQAAGAAAALVASRAATRDAFDGPELVKVFAAITIAFALVPALTPLLGGVVEWLAGWRAVFGLTLIVGLLVTAHTLSRLPETLPQRKALSIQGATQDYVAVFKAPSFLKFTAITAFVIGSMSVFFAGSPQLFIGELGMSPAEYGLYPPLAVAGFVIGAIIVRRVSQTMAPITIVGIGLGIMAVALVAMTTFPLVGVVHKHIFNASMVAAVSGLGVIMPTATAAALENVKLHAGTASAVIGAAQMAAGVVGTLVVSAAQGALPVIAMPLSMSMMIALAIIAFAAPLLVRR